MIFCFRLRMKRRRTIFIQYWMDGLKLFWASTAKRQQNQIFDYWNKHNKTRTYSKKLAGCNRRPIKSKKYAIQSRTSGGGKIQY